MAASEPDPVLRSETGKFVPGVSGNPGGRPRADAELVKLSQEFTAKAVKELIRIATKSKSDQVRVSAISQILDRGWGRPRQAVEVSGEDGAPLGLRVVWTDPPEDDG